METQAEYATKQIIYLPVGHIGRNPRNPRKTIDENSIQELAKSILEIGVMSPIIVRPAGDGFELVAGERRWRATQVAGVDQIPAIIRELTDDEAMDLAITENLQRQDVSPLEEADAFQSLVDHRGYDVKQLADRFGKSETYIRGRLKLNGMIPEFKIILENDVIGMSHANVISKLDPETQGKVFKQSFGDMDKSWWSCPTAIGLKRTIQSHFSSDLENATFSLTDPDLIPSAGACSGCQWNSAGDGNLFPDSTAGRCLKTSCFEEKTTIHFQTRFNQAKEDPEILIVHKSYYVSHDDRKAIEKFRSEGINVIERDALEFLEKPEPPDPIDTDDYDMADPDDIERFQEDTEENKQELEEYQKELAEYEEKIKSPAVVKYFVAVGNSVGEEGFCIPRPAAGNQSPIAQKKINPVDSLRVQIVDLKDQIERTKVLDDQKVFDIIKPEFLESEYHKNETFFLSELEWDILYFIMMDQFSWFSEEELSTLIFGKETRWPDPKQKLEALKTMDDSKKALLVRNYIRWKVTNHAGPDKSNQKAFTELLFRLSKTVLGGVHMEETRMKISIKSDKKRKALQERIDQLEAEIAKLEAESKPKGKKKGKSSGSAN